MANELLEATGKRYHYASIDTAPAAGGFWSTPISVSKYDQLFFIQKGGGVGIVTIQFATPDDPDTWIDYSTEVTIEDGVRCIVDDSGFGIKWRAGIKEDEWTSDTVITGFDW